MPPTVPTVWAPNPSASSSGVPDLATLSGIQIPMPVDGILVFVDIPGDFYLFLLNSGAPVNPPLVVATFLGGTSRWIKTNISAIPSFIVTQAVFVQKDGNDTTGDGSPFRPFLTIEKAMSSITDNAQTKAYAVYVGPGNFADPFQIKPWVAVIGAVSGGNGVQPNGNTLTQILAPADTCGFDASWATSGFSVAWYSNVGFQNHQTWNQAAVVGTQPQLNFSNCIFDGGADYLGPGTVGFDNVMWMDCLSYGGVLVQGWQFLWTRNSTFLGGTVRVNAGPLGATEDTIWLSQGSAVGATIAPTNVVVHWAAPSPHLARGDLANTSIVGTLTLDGVSTSFKATDDGIPPVISLLNGASPPVLLSEANAVNYTPTVLADWSGVAPTSVMNALDRIAAKITPIP